ncbi:YoaK family protein [Yinghuangia soli]|uniref:DUF1275 domain-containing protein n=1 Tax=Yinghuangia soli TaxID=2908204 RepID=A0AA41Q798_9ACTN|nr:YoaK family protein [Yinghuangia soli]MCF2531477.1 DUF1275 domain-containing protein [Yinghuangia soli]
MAGTAHRRFVPALLLLTVVTGFVDAVSYLALGHVFVANMTGNVVFLGFAWAGAPGLSAQASLVSLGAFLVGALLGGRVHARSAVPVRRGRLFATAVTVQAVLMAASTALALPDAPPGTAARYALIAVLGVCMGLQNAVVRRLAVPDLTTTVLTLTLAGIAADPAEKRNPARRLASAVCMFGGALAGAVLVLRVHLAWALGISAVLLAGLAAVSLHVLRAEGRRLGGSH